jgi:glycosyltransferase involved in cell wall biosynthesis
MRIGIDFYSFDPECSGGVYTFALGITKGLLGNLQHTDSVVIIISEKNKKQLKLMLANLPVTFINISAGPWYRYINRLLWLLAWATGSFKLRFWYDKYFRAHTMNIIDSSIDALIVPVSVLNFYALKSPSVLCIHDIQQEYHPELFTLNQRILRWASYRLSCWKADAIQASSKYIKDCLIEKFKFINPNKIFIAHEGVDLDKFSMAIQGERPETIASLKANSFVFYPAQLWPHKNHSLLIEALSIFRNKMGYELPCVLTGYDYGHWKSIHDLIDRHQLKCVHYLGRVSFAQVLWLYQNCSAVLALGLHESSSLPVREGAVFGRPLICSNIPPNIETQEFLSIRIVDNTNPYDLAGVFFELITNDKEMFAEAAKNTNLVKIFDWNCIAKKYISVLNQLTSV